MSYLNIGDKIVHDTFGRGEITSKHAFQSGFYYEVLFNNESIMCTDWDLEDNAVLEGGDSHSEEENK